jgi:hypothetical protein
MLNTLTQRVLLGRAGPDKRAPTTGTANAGGREAGASLQLISRLAHDDVDNVVLGWRVGCKWGLV